MKGERELVRTESHLSTTLDGEEVILHQESEEYFGLNEVGTLLWDLLAEPHTVDELVAEVQAEFDVAEAESRGDVEAFLEDLEDAKLIEKRDARDP